MSSVQRNEFETDIVKLEKKSKKELVSIITTLQHSVKQDERRKQWGQQFDGWLIWASQKGIQVVCTLSQSVVADEKKMFESSFGYRTIIGIPKRVDKYCIQFQLNDGNKIWINKTYIITCSSFNKKDEEPADS